MGGSIFAGRVVEAEANATGRLADLYARHFTSSRRLPYLVTGDFALAEDLAQDAFCRCSDDFRTFAIRGRSRPICGELS